MKTGYYRGINSRLYGAKVTVYARPDAGGLFAEFDNGEKFDVDAPWMQAFVDAAKPDKPSFCPKCALNEHSAAALKMVELVWCSLKHDHEHKDRRETAWGTKTECGLAACFDRIMKEV
jgi:hypothetical protein